MLTIIHFIGILVGDVNTEQCDPAAPTFKLRRVRFFGSVMFGWIADCQWKSPVKFETIVMVKWFLTFYIHFFVRSYNCIDQTFLKLNYFTVNIVILYC